MSPRQLLLAALLVFLATSLGAETYFPPKGEWARRAPAEVGMHAAKLQAAIAFAVAQESSRPKDVAQDLRETFGVREPRWRLLGPTAPRGGLTGLVIRRGHVVAAWGDPDRVDMTHSVAKTFLTTVTGLAWQRGMIRSLSDHPRDLPALAAYFEGEHNGAITWEHLLRQTSDWSGTLWDIPDWADRPVGATPAEHPNRPLHPPGTFYKYNDVRINLLALCTLHVWQRPLPEVLRSEVMDPIGASDTWRWEGYENSWIELGGRRVQSVSGGGHFGGGMFINAWDLARFGYLFLRQGRWAGRQIVAEDWIALARSPGPANAQYGFANWFLNPERQAYPSTPATAVTFQGNGANIVYLDWENDLVVVVRWIESRSLDKFLGQVLAAINDAG